MSVALATMLAATCAAGSAHTPEFNIKAYGAQEGGNVVCTKAITAAVAAARAAVVEGSAHEADVVVPAGKVRRSSHLVFHRCERDQLDVRRGVRCARGSTLNDTVTFCVCVPHLPTFQTDTHTYNHRPRSSLRACFRLRRACFCVLIATQYFLDRQSLTIIPLLDGIGTPHLLTP